MYILNKSLKDGKKTWWHPTYVRPKQPSLIPDTSKSEFYALKTLGEEFAVGSLKGSVDYGSEKLRKNTAAMQTVRDKIFKETFRDLDRFCVMRGLKKRSAKMAFFISHEYQPVINSHYMLYRENFDYWHPFLIRNFLKERFNKRTHSNEGYCQLYEYREGVSYQKYITKKEDKDYDYLKPFFSKGLRDKIESIN